MALRGARLYVLPFVAVPIAVRRDLLEKRATKFGSGYAVNSSMQKVA